MADIINAKDMVRLVNKLKKLGDRYQTERTRSVIVGYTANYAAAVHEMPMIHPGLPRDPRKRPGIKHQKNPRKRKPPEPKGKFWDPQGRGQNKFLEQPFREMQPELRRIIRKAAQRQRSIPQALLQAGRRLQAVSQKLVPADTGNLKASAFTRLETV